MPDLKRIRTLDGYQVERQDFLYVPAPIGNWVPTAPYIDHFIYRETAIGRPAFMCTCGSFASVVNMGSGLMLMCHIHATIGEHTTGGGHWV